jgi:hypothetical protein
MEKPSEIPQPEVIKLRALAMQVCVPASYSDERVQEFANEQVLCGTTNGWKIAKEGNEMLDGCSERVPCETRKGFVHIVLLA